MSDPIQIPPTADTGHTQENPHTEASEHAQENAHTGASDRNPESLPPEEDLQKSLKLIVRELGRIQQTLARMEGQLSLTGDSTGETQPWKTLTQSLTEIKERVTREAISSARERRDIRRSVADLQAQVESTGSGRRNAPGILRDIPPEHQRVGIFVDVQNIFYAAKQFNARLDFEKLLKVAVGPRRLIRALAYVVQSPEVDQSGFISMLQQKGYEVRQKELRLRSDGSAKGDWDMGMAIDIMGLLNKLDVVVLVTGDGDFVSLVNLVKTVGPRVEVISFLHNTARDLVQCADHHIPIEEALLMRVPNNGNGTPARSADASAPQPEQVPAADSKQSEE